MPSGDQHLTLRLAQDDGDVRAAQRLRYRVFVTELGGDGPMVDHQNGLEIDEIDPFYDHLLLIDETREPAQMDHVVGVYRLMRADAARRAGGFYSQSEYDLTPLISSPKTLLELGRSCVHPDYRGGKAMYFLWRGLADYVAQHRIDVLFGVASFHGTDIARLAEPLSMLHHRHLAPPEFRARARLDNHQPMDMIPQSDIDRRRALRATPPLIKAYLRLGGFVGDGAYIDHAFKTTDVFLVMDTQQMNQRMRRLYTADHRA
jgi:putative hemolysin